MSPAGLRPAIRALAQAETLQRRHFTSPTRPCQASILFALGALSNSRETQHFNKITRLNRIEHSPPLKLIKTSEIDPYPLPDTPKPIARSILPSPWVGRTPRSWQAKWDEKALKAGRAVLADNARREARLKLALKRTQRRVDGQQRQASVERDVWMREQRRLRGEIRMAGLWIMASIATATALATWRFWPQDKGRGLDHTELGRRIASRAQAAIPLPQARSSGGGSGNVRQEVKVADVSPMPAMINAEAGLTVPAIPTQAVSNAVSEMKVATESTRSWWKGLFWKQE